MKNTQEEIWKEVSGYEGIYEVSSLGRVKSLKRKGAKGGILTESKRQDNYYGVGLTRNRKLKTYTIHSLVAIAFLGHKPSGWQICVDHIDGNRLNNHVDNLQIVTHRENVSVCHRSNKNDTSSAFVGVFYNNTIDKWQARIQLDKKVIHLGYFDDEKTAHDFYLSAYKNLDSFENPTQFREIIVKELNYIYTKKIFNNDCVSYKKRDGLWTSSAYAGNRKMIFIRTFISKDDAIFCSKIAKENISLYDGDNAKFRGLIKDLYQKQKEGN